MTGRVGAGQRPGLPRDEARFSSRRLGRNPPSGTQSLDKTCLVSGGLPGVKKIHVLGTTLPAAASASSSTAGGGAQEGGGHPQGRDPGGAAELQHGEREAATVPDEPG